MPLVVRCCDSDLWVVCVRVHSVFLSAFTLSLCVVVISACSSASRLHAQSTPSSDSVFRNTSPNVAYVGSKTCIIPGCHEDIGRSYFATPHGQSMAPANSPTELGRVRRTIQKLPITSPVLSSKVRKIP